MTAKDEILARIRTALPGEPLDPQASYSRIARDYIQKGRSSHAETLELLIDRLLDYDTEILQLDTDEGIAAAVDEALSRKGETSLLAPAGFPAHWLPAAITVVRDTELTTPQLDAEFAVITTAEAAVASTGTIILVHDNATTGGTQGRRALTLLPDHHICLLRRDQVSETLAEALKAIGPHSRRPITTISGPSATSDIEMTRIRGVHGPRRLTVILHS